MIADTEDEFYDISKVLEGNSNFHKLSALLSLIVIAHLYDIYNNYNQICSLFLSFIICSSYPLNFIQTNFQC